MAQIEHIGAGSIGRLADILAALAPRRVFLVSGKSSFADSGAAPHVMRATAGMDVLHFTDFGRLPLHEDIQKGIEVYQVFSPDVVVAVGGGHVIDVAKAINHYTAKRPLVAIPTTAGSGSQATRFAVIYKDGQKASLESDDILPAFAIVDSALAASLPAQVAAASALDALCQSVESLWSRGATAESRGYADRALELLVPNIVAAVERRDPAALEVVAKAAHLAGKAINISKTTACHAFSYGLTYRFGVPHGMAVAVFLPAVWRHNDFTHAISLEELEDLLKRFGITTLSRFGVSAGDIESLAAQVNTERLGNNPRPFSDEEVIRLFRALL